jgi:hypothetical protein
MCSPGLRAALQDLALSKTRTIAMHAPLRAPQHTLKGGPFLPRPTGQPGSGGAGEAEPSGHRLLRSRRQPLLSRGATGWRAEYRRELATSKRAPLASQTDVCAVDHSADGRAAAGPAGVAGRRCWAPREPGGARRGQAWRAHPVPAAPSQPRGGCPPRGGSMCKATSGVGGAGGWGGWLGTLRFCAGMPTLPDALARS